MKLDAVDAAWPDYWQYANIREMHDPKKAAGVGMDFTKTDKGYHLQAEIVKDDAVKLVRKKVYKGFSVGGKILETVGDWITKIVINEVSIVDRPANPDCAFDMAKAAKASSTTTEVPMPDPVAPAVPAPAAAVEKTAKPVDLKKSLGLITWLVSVLEHLEAGDIALAYEIGQEGHLQPQKAKIDAARKMLGEAMSEIAAQEVAEMAAEPGHEESAEPAAMEAAAKTASLAKAGASEEHVKAIHAVRKAVQKMADAAGVPEEACDKCSKLHKAMTGHHADLGKLIGKHGDSMGEGAAKAFKAHHEAMGATLDEHKEGAKKEGEAGSKDSEAGAKEGAGKEGARKEGEEKDAAAKAVQTEDLAKMQKDRDDLAKRATDAEAELAKAQKELAAIKAAPAPAKGSVKEVPAVLVPKTADTGTPETVATDLAKRKKDVMERAAALKPGDSKGLAAIAGEMWELGLIEGQVIA